MWTYNPLLKGETNGKSKGIGVYSVRVESRADKLGNSTQARRCGSIGSGKVERWEFLHEAEAYSVGGSRMYYEALDGDVISFSRVN